jgi:hypothetical protein
MLKSLLKHRSALSTAVCDPEFGRLATSSRGGLDGAAEEAMLEEELDALTRALAGGVEDVESGASRTPDIPDTVRENKKYATVFKAVRRKFLESRAAVCQFEHRTRCSHYSS